MGEEAEGLDKGTAEGADAKEGLTQSGGARSLGKRALGSSAWTIGGYIAAQALRLGGNLILTRLLFPEAFGLMAIVNVLLQGLVMFSDVGIGPAIIQNPRGRDPAFLNTAWTIQLGRGCLLWLAAIAVASPMADFYSESDPLAASLLFILPVAGLRSVGAGLLSTRYYSYRRNLQLARITILDLGGQTVGLVVMVVWAWVHPTVWALVAGALVMSVVRTSASYLFLDGVRNRLFWDRSAGLELFRFGRWVFLSTLITFLAAQSDRLLFGKLVSWEQLGVYGIAVSLAVMPTLAISRLGSAVVFPLLARLRETDPAGLNATVGKVRMPLILSGGILIAAMIPSGPALIDLLYDDRYLAAGGMLQILLFAAWFQVLETQNGALLLSHGRTGWLAAGNAYMLGGLVIFLPLGYHYYGLAGALWGLVGANSLRYMWSVLGVSRLGLRVLLVDLVLSGALLLAVATGLLLATFLRDDPSLRAEIFPWWAIGRVTGDLVGGTPLSLIVVSLATLPPWIPLLLYFRPWRNPLGPPPEAADQDEAG